MARVYKHGMGGLVRLCAEQMLQISVKFWICRGDGRAGYVLPSGSDHQQPGRPYGAKHVAVFCFRVLFAGGDQRPLQGAETFEQPRRYRVSAGADEWLNELRHERYLPVRRTRFACRPIPSNSVAASR